MNINITNPLGVICKTQGKYCAEDITVVPTLEEKSATPMESAQEIVPSAGNCGISKLNLGAVQTETKTITPTTSEQTFTPTSGKYFKQVICQAIQAYQGTATPAQGEQTINPTSGKFFNSFKVAPIPSDYIIPSGTLQITDNGAKDVTNYKNVNVNVEPNLEQKTVTITENGTTEVTPTAGKDGISKVTINTNVPTASAVEEVATAAAMNALLIEVNVGKYYKFTGTTDSNYTNGDLYLVEGGTVGVSRNWKFGGTAAFAPADSLSNEISITGKIYKDATFIEDFTAIYYKDDWSYIVAGTGTYWDTTNNTWGRNGGNILKFDTDPSGSLLDFLEAHAQPI